MRIRLIKINTIANYVSRNQNSKKVFDTWLTKLKNAQWETSHDITQTFNTADFLGKSSNRIVFNIGGNKYRMICSYVFGQKNIHLFINWIGTHAEYTELCDDKLQYTISEY